MSQRDDASDPNEQDEETDAPHTTDDAGTADTTAGGEDDGDDAAPAAEESDGPAKGDTGVPETNEEADLDAAGVTGEESEGDAEATERAEGSESTEAVEEDEEVEESGGSEEVEEGGEVEETEESGAAPGGIVESEVGESGVTEEDASSTAPTKGPDEMYCQSCGEPIKTEAEVCPHCGVRQGGSSSQEKNSAISFIASLIIPGAGQAYNEQFGRAIAVFIGAIVADTILIILGTLLSIILIGVLFFLLIPVVHVAIAYDAYNQAEKINRGEVTV